MIQDLSLGIFPTRRTQEKLPSVELSPPNKTLEDILCRGLENSSTEPGDLYEAIELFTEDVARTIAYFGEALYEVVFRHNDETNQEEFMLAQIPNWGLLRIPLFYVQSQLHYPQSMNPKSGIKRVLIPTHSVFRFRIPGGLFPAIRYRRLLEVLAKLSEASFPPPFWSPNTTKTTYDYSHHTDIQMVKLARTTRRIGWTARQRYQERMNEFYFIYRYLRFECFRAQLRESIVDTINKILQEVGPRLGFNSSIVLQGFPQSSEIEAAINALIDGRIGFSTAIEKTKPYSGTVSDAH